MNELKNKFCLYLEIKIVRFRSFKNEERIKFGTMKLLLTLTMNAYFFHK